jgi:LysM repeat protein
MLGVIGMFTHEIQPGDTLDRLAERFETSVDELLANNEMITTQRLIRGTVIRIPVPMIPPTVPTSRPFRNVDIEVRDNILFIFFTNQFVFRVGEPVVITLIKVNISRQTITLVHPTSQLIEIVVRSRFREIWRLSQNRVFLPVETVTTLQPGQSEIATETWNQTTNEGARAPRGVFTVTGENTARNILRVPLSVRIRLI